MMTAANQKRVELAQRMADIFAQHPHAKAMALTGSVAMGVADDVSDVDMAVYYAPAPPTRVELEEVRQRLGGTDWIFFLGDPEEGGCAVSFAVEGVKCDFAHASITRWEANMDEVMTLHDADSPMQKALAGILDAVPLFGEAYIARWQERAARYPDALAEAMVRKHLKFYPPWVTERMTYTRGDLLFLYEIFAEAGKNILGILMGLNRRYHWGEYKHTDTLIAGLNIAPVQLFERLQRVLRDEPERAARELHTLIEDVLALVQEHLPHLDITENVQRYRRPLGT